MVDRDTVTLRPNRLLPGLLLLLSLAGCYGSLQLEDPAARVGLAGLFACFVLWFLLDLLPGASYLRLDPLGFEVCSRYRRRRYSWAEVGDIRAADIVLQAGGGRSRGSGIPFGLPIEKRILFDDNKPRKGSAWLSRLLLKPSRGTRLPSNYDRQPEELAQLMTIWRDRALSKEP